jgi:HSP20 family molecular chaperone IbpA
MLSVSGRVSQEHYVDEKAQYYVRELRRSAFERSVYLPNNITGDPEAVMKNEY